MEKLFDPRYVIRIISGWSCLIAVLTLNLLYAGTPLAGQIDTFIAAKHKGPAAGPSNDAEFLRRVYLDLAGTIPSSELARQFFVDKSPNKRTKLIDQLLAGSDYPRRMQEAVSVMLLERRKPSGVTEYEWQHHLRQAFAENRPWDQIARDMLSADGLDAATRPAMRFVLDRGSSNHDLLTRDVGRIFLGMDLQCAQCHDHPSIKDYKQAHYFGVFAFLNQTGQVQAKDNKETLLVQKANVEKVEFKSVFTDESGTTGPKLPAGKEIAVPAFEKGKGFEPHKRLAKNGVPIFYARGHLAKELASVENAQFKRNIANRLWALVMGRGLVDPLDMHHAANPPSHPELLDRLTHEIGEMKFDVKEYVRALMLSQTYQRSSLLPSDATPSPPESYTVAILKQLSAEQLFAAVMQATGQTEIVNKKIDADLKTDNEKAFQEMQGKPDVLAQAREEKRIELRNQFVSSFGNPPGEAEDEFNPTLSGALFLSNGDLLIDWLSPHDGNLIDRLMKIEDAAADELYLSVLTRLPEHEERAEVVEHLKSNTQRRAAALGELAWGLLASTEFRLNH